MTNPYIHCPFCCNNIDVLCDANVEYRELDYVFVTCENCKKSFTLIVKDINALAHRGPCIDIQKPCKEKGMG